MIVVIWCCHVRRKKHVSHVTLQNALYAQWALFWGGSRSTKPCFFPCEVVAAGDERYLVCAAGAAGAAAVVSVANVFLLCVLQQVAVPVCVVLCVC